MLEGNMSEGKEWEGVRKGFGKDVGKDVGRERAVGSLMALNVRISRCYFEICLRYVLRCDDTCFNIVKDELYGYK